VSGHGPWVEVVEFEEARFYPQAGLGGTPAAAIAPRRRNYGPWRGLASQCSEALP